MLGNSQLPSRFSIIPSTAAANGPAGEVPFTNEAWVLVAAILGSSMAFIDGTVTNVALPALQSAFRVSGSSLQWIVEAYALSLSSLLLLGGSFGDLYGRRRTFLLGVVICLRSPARFSGRLLATARILAGSSFLDRTPAIL